MNAKEKLKLIGHILSATDSSPADLSRITRYVDSFPEKAAETARSELRENGALSDKIFSNSGSWCKKVDRDSIFHNVGSWCKKLDRNDVFKNNGSWCKKVDGLPSSSTAVND